MKDTETTETNESDGCLIIFSSIAIIIVIGILIKLGEIFWKFCLFLNILCKGQFLVYFASFCIIMLVCFFLRRNIRMFEKLMMNPEEKEFAKLTRDLSREKYISLKTYFKATGTSVESSNNFLKSCRGVAFLDAYKKVPINDNVELSRLILDVEREEQIISCAVDILKTY